MVLVSGDLVEVGEGEVEGTSYYFAKVYDDPGNGGLVEKTRISLEKHEVKKLSPFEGDKVVVRCAIKATGKLAFNGLVSKELTDLILTGA